MVHAFVTCLVESYHHLQILLLHDCIMSLSGNSYSITDWKMFTLVGYVMKRFNDATMW